MNEISTTILSIFGQREVDTTSREEELIRRRIDTIWIDVVAS